MSTSTPSLLLEEGTSKLPLLKAQGKYREPLFQACVNAYVVGTRRYPMAGRWATPLYWISLVGMRGQGTTLQGLFSRLVASSPREITLGNDVDDVQLAHHAPSLKDLGYSIHWNFEQAEILPSRDLHAVIESRQLTVIDPVKGMASVKRGRLSPTSGKEKKGKGERGRASLSTMKGGGMQAGGIGDYAARESRPAFLLMGRGEKGQIAQRHLAFLDQRVPWPMIPHWADFLFERGMKQGEIESLSVWCYTGEEETGGSRPFVTEAYLCRPNPAKLLTDLQEALRAGIISTTPAQSGEEEEEREPSRHLELVAC